MTASVLAPPVPPAQAAPEAVPDSGPVSSGRRGVRLLLIGTPLAVLALLVFYPLAFTVQEAFTGHSRLYYRSSGFGAVFGQVLASVRFRDALENTIIIAGLSTLGCLVLGFVLALIISFVPFPGSRGLARLIDAYLAFPSFLIALSFTFLYGSNGLVSGALVHALGLDSSPLQGFINSRWAVILAEVTFYTPFVLRPLFASFSQLDTGVIEVASSLGARPFRVVRQVIFPEAIPALLAGGSLTLVLTLNEFGIVAMIGAKGVNTLTLEIYSQAVVNNDSTIASSLAVINIVLSLSLYSLYRFILNRGKGRANAGVL